MTYIVDKADADPSRRPAGRRRAWPGLAILRNWRLWLPAVILAEAAAFDLELIVRGLTARYNGGRLNAPLLMLEGLFIAVPVALFVVWRAAAHRATDSYRKLKASEALREDLVNMLVHDLRNSLTSSGASLEVISMSETLLAKLDDREKQTLATAQENLRRAEGMIGDILNVAQAEEGDMPTDLGTGDLGQTIRSAILQMTPRAAGLGISLSTKLPADLPPTLMDTEKVERILDNLLVNALRFTPRGGRIEISATHEDGHAQVTVWDDGKPIPEHVRDRIFDKFVQAAAARQHGRASVGLGLTFCKLAIEAMHGQIWVDSKPDGGTSFTFTLPLAQ